MSVAQHTMKTPKQIVFLVDVDDTLLANDRIQDDLQQHIEKQFGPENRDRFWAIQEQLFKELGYRDYLGALQRFRVEHPYEPHLITAANYLVDYPFANRLYPGALDVLERFRQWGRTVILTDGDVVFQPRKVQRSGLWEAVAGNVLIYIHKGADAGRRGAALPGRALRARRRQARILAAVKRAWGERVTTVFVRQGHYALDPSTVSQYPAADVTIECIADLAEWSQTVLRATR